MESRGHRRGLYAALLIAGVSVAGCATAGRQAAIQLADAGAVTAKQTETLLVQTTGTLQPYVESQFLLAPLRGIEPPGGELLKTIERVDRALSLRIRVMTNLGAAYAAIKEHASHDAAAAVEKGVADVTGSVNAYAALVAPGAALIPETAAFVISKAAGAIAGAKQVRQLKAASVAIRERIEKFRGVLAKEADLLESIRRVTDATTATNTQVLWDLGLGRPDPIVRSHLETFGLQYDAQQFTAAMKQLEKEQTTDSPPPGCPAPCNTKAARLRFGVAQVVRQRANRSIMLGREVVTQHADALATLEAAHRDFEAGKFVDAAGIATELETLRAVVDELTRLRRQ
jgi:hypothetical protein